MLNRLVTALLGFTSILPATGGISAVLRQPSPPSQKPALLLTGAPLLLLVFWLWGMLLPLSAHALGLQCSPTNSGRVAINELFTGGGAQGSLEYLELYFNEAQDIAGWKVYWKDAKNEPSKSFTLGTGLHQAISYLPDGSTYSDHNCPDATCTTPTKFPKGTFLVYDLTAISPNSGEFLLVDTTAALQANAPVVVNYFYYYNNPSQLIQSYTITPESNDCSLSFIATSNNKDMSRLTDGQGDMYTEYPDSGGAIVPTTGESNMGGDTPTQFDTDVSITKTVDQAAVIAGTEIVYTITVTNNGPYTATDIIVKDDFPGDKLLYTGSSTSLDGDLSPFGTFTFDGANYIWQFGLLPTKSYAELEIYATVKSDATETISNTTFVHQMAQTNISGETSDTVVIDIVDAFELDHIRIEHDGNGLTCAPETVTVKACSNAACTALYTGGVTGNLTATGAPAVNWVGGAGFSIGVSGYTEKQVQVTTADTVTLDANSIAPGPNDGVKCFTGACEDYPLVFSDAGFIFSATHNGGAVTIPSQVAGTASATYYLRAVQTNTETKACETALAGESPVDFAYECNDPADCHDVNLMTVNGGTATAITRNDNGSISSYQPVSMTFDANGNAPFTFVHEDVGRVRLHARKMVNDVILAGSTNNFVVKPDSFDLSAVKQTAPPLLVNPGADDFDGGKFVKAGEPFSVTVTAKTATGGTAFSFGREAEPEEVTLTHNLVAPAGNAGTLANPTIDGDMFTDGVAATANLSWDEVGIITLTPGNSDYMGAGSVIGTTSGNIGRFIPDHFEVTPGTVTHGCNSFTYLGQADFTTVFTLTARNTGSGTALNYTGDFAKMDLTVRENFSFSGDSLPPSTFLLGGSQPSGSWDQGVALDVTAGHLVSRPSSPVAPATITVLAQPADADGVTTAAPVNITPDGVAMRWGRIVLENAHGPETEALTMRLLAQYYDGISFALNPDDTCSLYVAADDLACDDDLIPADDLACTNVTASGTSIGHGQHFTLSKPDNGKTGLLRYTLTVGSWLQHDWDDNHSYDNNPAATATFGIYRGNDRIINWREVQR